MSLRFTSRFFSTTTAFRHIGKMADRCYIVPPHLLEAIAESTHNDEAIRESARASLVSREQVSESRKAVFAALTLPHGYRRDAAIESRRQIIPEGMLTHIAESESVDDETRARAKRDLLHLQTLFSKIKTSQEGATDETQGLAAAKPKDSVYRAVYDAKHATDESQLPGKMMRAEGEKASKDKAVNDAYDNVGHVLAFYKEKFDWKSLDNKNADVISSVHYGRQYENAFWDPQERQMVYGDGGSFLNNFTGCIDVIGHEITHAVTEHTSPLDYQGQSGALNEHISDVFGIMIKHYVFNTKAADADWLIGEDCILPGVKGVALRSMKAPGTAYDDPRFGKDPQPDSMAGYKETAQDNGGVHLFSGIPNKVFYSVSIAFGGYSFEKAGQIWWKTMNGGKISPRCNFLQFADVTVETAQELYGEDAAKTVRKAWNDVGVTRGV
ncbi:hypothetical protein VHEMI03845 [[Torrubiella] hemipterigena]|uniref:Metalloprotease n=1 Tax=[Torrubiella] hemipterigena TaxID=1531966 RepID=A0A0A1SZK9_9HYPO|nr:hypothetical protein VHEMI03845 [[Torrubiella] hemipterigena]